jgi:hypothetical protein
MLLHWVVVTLVVLSMPVLAFGQTVGTPERPAGPGPIVPPTPTPGRIVVDPKLPPPPTISAEPEVLVPAPTPEALRPVKTFEFRPTLGIAEEYSDNFNLSATNKVSNFRSSVSPGLQVLLNTGLLTGQASYAPTAFYDTSNNEAGVNHALAALLNWQATPRLRLSVGDNFARTDEPERADRLNLRRGRETFTSNVLSLVGDYVVEPYAAQALYNFSTFFSETDRTITHTPGVAGSIAFGQIHTLRLAYEYLHSETTVEQSPTAGEVVAFGAATRDSTTTGHQATATFSRELTKDLVAGVTAVYAPREQEVSGNRTTFTRRSISLFTNYVVPDILVVRTNLGVAQLERESSSGRPLVTTNSDITYYRGPATLGLRVERGFSETFGRGENFGVVETLGFSGSVGYQFTPLLSARVAGSYRENEFTGAGGGQAGRDDKIVGAAANVSYQMLRWLTASLAYGYTDTKSSDPLGSYVESRVHLALTASFY